MKNFERKSSLLFFCWLSDSFFQKHLSPHNQAGCILDYDLDSMYHHIYNKINFYMYKSCDYILHSFLWHFYSFCTDDNHDFFDKSLARFLCIFQSGQVKNIPCNMSFYTYHNIIISFFSVLGYPLCTRYLGILWDLYLLKLLKKI